MGRRGEEKRGWEKVGKGRGGKKAQCLHTTVSLELAAMNNLDQSPLFPNDIANSKLSASDATTT